MTLAQLSPTPIQKFFDNNGLPLAGGKLYTYAAGTSIPQATYPVQSETTPNTNPIILNARGECALWLDPNSTYKINLTDSLGNQIPGWPQDNISGVITQSQFNTFLTDSPPYEQTATEAANGVIPANFYYLPGDWRRYGVIPGAGPTVDQSLALQNAINSGQPVVQMWGAAGDIYYGTTLTINRSLIFSGSGGEGNDAAGGNIGASTTRLFYTGTGVGIQITAPNTDGIANLHLENFALWGTSSAVGGIDLGHSSGGTNLILKSSFNNLQVYGFIASSAYGFLLEGILESIFENCYAYGCYDGFLIDGTVTTCSFRSCASRENVRYGYNIQSASALSFEARSFAESNASAGLNIATSASHFIDIFGYYSENNNTSTGTAPIQIGTDGATTSPYNINFFGGVIADPGVGGLFVNLDHASSVTFDRMVFPSYSAGFAKQTANTLQCVIKFPGLVWSVLSSNITGYTSGGLEVCSDFPTNYNALNIPGGLGILGANGQLVTQSTGWGTPTAGSVVNAFPGSGASTAQCGEALSIIIAQLIAMGLLAI